MDKTTFRKKGISLLTGIIKQREWLLRHDKGHLESNWCKTEMENIKYALPRLKDPQKLKSYLERKEADLRLLIPSTNKHRHDELRELIEETLN